jgi:hypothetical protein
VRGLRANFVCLLAPMLALVAAVLSGGGVARFTHVMIAHGGGTCEHAVSHRGTSAAKSTCASAHGGHAQTSERAGAHDHATPSNGPAPTGSSEQDDCPICAELAFSAGAPSLHSPFVHVIALLAIVHEREASQLPEPHAPDAVSARPPPFLT